MVAFAPSRAESLSSRQRVRNDRARICQAAAALLVAGFAVTSLTGCATDGGARTVEYDYEQPAALRGQPAVDANAGRAATHTPPRPRKVTFDIPDDPDPALGGVSPETRRLAEQSQRDVDMLLSARRNGAMPTGSTGIGEGNAANASGGGAAATSAEADSTASPALGSPVAPPRRAIVWNDPPPQPARTSSQSGTIKPIPAATDLTIAGPPIQAPVQSDSSAASAVTDVAPAPPQATSQPDITVLRPDRIRQLTVDLARELYAEGAYSEHPLRELAAIAAMSMQDPQRRIDPAGIPDLTDDERAVLVNLQAFFTSVGQTLDTGSEVNAGVAQAAAELRTALVNEPQLKLPTVSLCTRVGGFGDYSPFDKSVFLAASDQKAIVYLEIDDFVSEINQDDEFVTELSQQLSIYSDRDGTLAWREDWQTATDTSRNKRQDFFTTQIITLPRALTVGKYTLKVRVRDDKSSAEAETSVPFEIVADAKMLQ